MQMCAVPQFVPFASAVPAAHFWPVWPLTVTLAHVSAPLHGFVSAHCVSDVHENVQFDSQPVPGPLFAVPKSHCSLPSTMPLPQLAPLVLQMPVVPQIVLSGSQVPAEHSCVVSLHVPCPAQISVGVQSRVESVDTQLNAQSLLQPSPSVEFASSHSSLPVT